MIIGIDAHNIRGNGGSVVHLRELLANADPTLNGFTSIVVWTNKEALKVLPKNDFINYIVQDIRNSISGLFWQKYKLREEAKKLKCDVLFFPGGIYLGNFKPFVAFSQSMLPFDQKARKLYKGTLLYWILVVKKWLMLKTFNRSNGIIFVSNALKKKVEKVSGKAYKNSVVIHHGVNEFFKAKGKRQKKDNGTIKLLTVASHALHKNLVPLVSKIAELRGEGLKLTLEIVGLETKYGSGKLYNKIKKIDPKNNFINVVVNVAYEQLPDYYNNADIFIASSICESFGLPLIEALVNQISICYQKLESFNEIINSEKFNSNVQQYSNIDNDFTESFQLLLKKEYPEKSVNINSLGSWKATAKKTLDFCVQSTKLSKFS